MQLQIWTILLCIFAADLGVSSLSGIPRSPNGNPDNETDRLPFNPCRGLNGPLCLDCKTQITCAEELINIQPCIYIDPRKPYCRGSACSAEPIVNCMVNKFRCTSIGPFPNPLDCTQYYFCPDLSMQGAITYQCPTNYVYDSKTGFCKEMKSSADCKTFDCIGKSNKYEVYTADKSILAYCADTPTIRETIMFRCKDKNMEYNPETLKCNYVCTDEGRFVDSLNCRMYYECQKNGSSFTLRHETCPGFLIFDAKLKMCVLGTNC